VSEQAIDLERYRAALEYIAGSLVVVNGELRTYGHPSDELRRCVERARQALDTRKERNAT
jgi:hypothetical protein